MKSSCNDPPKISGQILCNELELNQDILKLFGVQSLKSGTLIDWE